MGTARKRSCKKKDAAAIAEVVRGFILVADALSGVSSVRLGKGCTLLTSTDVL